MSTQDKFEKLLQKESEAFSETCEMMYHSQVENGRRFLCAMNNIVEHYGHCNSEQSSDINYQVIYLPMCPEWARELLVRFLIHKLAFTSSDELITVAKRKTAGDLVLPSKVTKKAMQQLCDERKYYKKFIKLFEGKYAGKERCGKSLFVVQDKDIVTRKEDKNPWLEYLYTSNLFDDIKDVIVTTSDTAHDLESQIRNNRTKIPKIENVYLFHSPNRGRLTFSYNRQQLERLNRMGVGIKNCFVFYISERPFRLYHIQDNVKYKLSSNLLNQEITRYDDFSGFITFTPSEIRTMFNRASNNIRYIIDSDERGIFTSEIDAYLDELSHNYKIKNALSLAVDSITQEEFLDECRREFGSNDFLSTVMPFLNYYQLLWDNEIKKNIMNCLDGCYNVAFVLPHWASKEQKRAIRKSYQTEDRKVFVIDFEELKDGVRADMVVFFAYRYTDSKYKTYPNSFDPLPLKVNQKGITIINRLTHNRYYEWNKHFYDKAYNGLLFSDFRKNLLGWGKRTFNRPVLPDIFDVIDEAEIDARDYMAEKCLLQFETGKNKVLSATRVIYHNGLNYCISSVKELPFEEGMGIALLDEVVDQIKELLGKKGESHLKSEDYIRRDKTYGLTEEQIASDIELWKILLKRKVDESSIDEVYESMFPVVKEISRKGFARWLDYDYPMIFPRSRKSQNCLLTFLGFNIGSPYHRVILTKKLMKNSNTRLLNSQIESLLQSILTVPQIKEDDYNEIFELHSEILTLLDINSAGDISTLVDLLEIDLKKLISVSYD